MYSCCFYPIIMSSLLIFFYILHVTINKLTDIRNGYENIDVFDWPSHFGGSYGFIKTSKQVRRVTRQVATSGVDKRFLPHIYIQHTQCM